MILVILCSLGTGVFNGLIFAITFPFRPLLYILAQIYRRWTTLGVLSSERDSLNHLSDILGAACGLQEGNRCLSADSREHLKEFGRTQTR